MKKYELTNETIEVDGRILHRIRALRDIPLHGVKAGDLCGYIEKEDNLSQHGYSWVGCNACVTDNAIVFGDVIVTDGVIR